MRRVESDERRIVRRVESDERRRDGEEEKGKVKMEMGGMEGMRVKDGDEMEWEEKKQQRHTVWRAERS